MRVFSFYQLGQTSLFLKIIQPGSFITKHKIIVLPAIIIVGYVKFGSLIWVQFKIKI
jgi:hypothetical protein